MHLNPITENTKAREVSFLPFYPGGQEHDSTTQPASNFFSTDSSAQGQPKVKPSSDFHQTTPGQTDSFGGISDQESAITSNLLTVPPNAAPAVHLNPITENTKAREVSFLPFYPGGREYESTTHVPKVISTKDNVKIVEELIRTTVKGTANQELQITSNPMTLPPNAPPAVHLNPITENTKAREVSFLPFYPGGQEHDSTTQPASNFFSTDSSSLRQPKVKPSADFLQTTPGLTDSIGGISDQESVITSNPLTIPPNAAPAVHLNPITENSREREISFSPFYPGARKVDTNPQHVRGIVSTDSSALGQPKVKSSTDFLHTTPAQTVSFGGISDQESAITSNPLTIPSNAAPAVHLNPITENSRAREISFSPFYPGAHKVDTSPQPVRGFDATDSLVLEQLKIKSSTDSGNQDEENSSSTPSLQTTFPEFVVPSTVGARSEV